MIKFGSCVEITLPENVNICLKKGDKLKGGLSVIGKIVVVKHFCNSTTYIFKCCCSPFLSLPCPRHLPKPAPMFCRITA